MISRRALLPLPFVAACGGGGSSSIDAAPIDAVVIDAIQYPDAAPGAYACLGDPLPTTAPDPIAIAGTAETLNGLSTSNAADVLVAVYKTGNPTPLATATTPATGDFNLSVETLGVPVDGYLKATKAGLLDYYLVPGAPLAADVPDAPVLDMTLETLGTVETLASVDPAPNPATVSLVGVVVQDCDGNPVAGATITVREGGVDVGDKRYVAGSLPSPTATATDDNGAAFVFNVPAGMVTVSATVNTMTLRAHTFQVLGGALYATLVVP